MCASWDQGLGRRGESARQERSFGVPNAAEAHKGKGSKAAGVWHLGGH